MSKKVPVQLPAGYVDFYISLESWQNQKQIQLKKNYSHECIDIKSIIAINEEPLINTIKFKIDGDEFKDLYLDFLSFLKEARESVSPNVDIILEHISLFDFEVIPNKVLSDDFKFLHELSEKIGISEDFLIFTLDHTLRPFLRVFAEPFLSELSKDDQPCWNISGVCPICGSKSHFSRLRASDGKRFMFCDRCFAEWEARFIFCVHCANDEPGTIKYFTVEDDESYQLYICEKCKGYLKTYDERPTGNEVDLFIANIETIYLDMLAEEKGYSNSPLTN